MNRFKRRPLAAAMLVAFSASAPEAVLAQQSQAEQTLPEVRVRGDSYRTESVVSPTRTETPLRDVPQFINTVPQSVMHAQGATSIQDALRNVPGISYAAAEGGTQSNMVLYLRGFPVNQDLYLDGMRDMGEYNRDLFATESVEVLKGPSALMFGRGSAGGLINQTSKIADLLPRKDVEVTVGSFDKKRLTGDLNVLTGDASAFRIVALAEDSGYYRYPRGQEKAGIAPSLRWGIGGQTEVMLSYFYLNEKSVTDYGQPTIYRNPAGTAAQAPIGFQGFAPIDARKYYGYANYDYADYQTNIGTFRIDHRFNDQVSLRNTLRVANYKRQSESTIPSIRPTDANGAIITAATPPELLMVVRDHNSGRTRDNDDNAIINQTDVIWKFSGLGMKHQVLTGLELSREKLNRWNYTLAGTTNVDTPLLNPDPSSALNYTKTPNQRGESSGDVVALVVQDQMEISKQWKALLGARLEKFSAEAKTTNIVAGTTAAGPFSRDDTMLSGRAGLIWQPSDPQSYYVSISNSYNPSGEMGVYSGTAQTNLSLVNQNLDPEENTNYEVGAQWDVGRGIQVRSALFRTIKENQRINDSVTNTTILGGTRQVQGVELQVSGQITSNWDIYASGALQDGKIVKAQVNQGNTPSGVAERIASVWTIYRLGGGWEVGGGMNYNSGAWLTDVNSGPNSAKIPAYTVFDATAAYVQRKYEIRLNVYNLTDELYYAGGYQNSPSRVIPGVPLSAAVTMRYSFN